MTDRLTPAMRVEVLELIWNYRSTPGNTLVRYITELRDEAARREAEGPLGKFGHHPDPAIDYCVEVEALEGMAFDRAKGVADHPDYLARLAEVDRFKVGGDLNAIAARQIVRRLVREADAPPPPAPFVTDHKWLDPECHASGCQTLILKAELEKLRDQRDKYMWQVRDTCARAEAAEARVRELEATLNADDRDRKASPLNVTGTVKLRYVERDPLAQGGNDDKTG